MNVLQSRLKPDWSSYIKLYFSKKEVMQLLTCLSNMDVRTGKTQIGLKLFTSALLPYSNIGVTFAFLRLSGNVPC